MIATYLRPADTAELQQSLAAAHQKHEPVEGVDLTALDTLVAFSPEDMTVTVQAGITLGVLQSHLARAGQWLPIDPPHPERTTIADVLHQDLSGPRRFGYGTIREHLIGIAFVRADGRLVRAGGRVVKNVAGYDLAKLVVGSRGRLGVAVEATFKLRPQPATEMFVEWHADALDDVERQIERVLAGPAEPVVLDLVRNHAHLAPSADSRPDNGTGARPTAAWTLVAGFAGHAADVAWQVIQLPGTWTPQRALEHEATFWADRRMADVRRTSVLPSRLISHLQQMPPAAVLARAGNGVVYSDESPAAPPAPHGRALDERLQALFDPHGILSSLQ